MDISEFFTAYFKNVLERPSALELDCRFCPLRKACQADEEARVRAGLEGESCDDFLARMLTT